MDAHYKRKYDELEFIKEELRVKLAELEVKKSQKDLEIKEEELRLVRLKCAQIEKAEAEKPAPVPAPSAPAYSQAVPVASPLGINEVASGMGFRLGSKELMRVGVMVAAKYKEKYGSAPPSVVTVFNGRSFSKNQYTTEHQDIISGCISQYMASLGRNLSQMWPPSSAPH